MKLPAKKTPLAKKQIPTLLGLGILIFSLVAGVLLFSNGTGVFSPRATPQTTPKNVKVTNLADKSFTVSFYTDEATGGFVKYGTQEGSLKSQASDDRDQLSGSVGDYQLHHITLRGLTPNTSYYYTLGTGSGARFDNNGAPFLIKTLPALNGTPPINKTIYGTVITEAGAPAEGSVVYVLGEGVAEMSALVKSSGSWALALSSARKTDGSGFAELTDSSSLNVIIQGIDPSKASVFSTLVANAQPVPEVILGDIPAAKPAEPAVVVPADRETAQPASGGLDDLLNQISDEAEDSVMNEQATESAVLDLATAEESDPPTLVPQPVIKGVASPGVTVRIEINSETQIIQTLVADQSGAFSIDLADFEELEPGEHTVTYSYTDPDSGQEVTKTQTFFVAGTTRQLAQANTGTNNTSFGSGNPAPVLTPTPTPTVTPTPTPATPSAIVATDSGTYKSGSVENTVALIVGGIFFILAGAWSWWLAHEVKKA